MLPELCIFEDMAAFGQPRSNLRGKRSQGARTGAFPASVTGMKSGLSDPTHFAVVVVVVVAVVCFGFFFQTVAMKQFFFD